jgi:pimeloyl-ACP methyl ester carboxylesterase
MNPNAGFEVTRFPGADAEADPVVFLHGYGCSSADWAEVASTITTGGERILLDFPGHGTSRAESARSFEELIEGTEQVLGDLGALPAIFVGHSMGGMVALALAERNPAAVGGLVLAECFPHLSSVVETFGGPESDADPYGFGSVMDHSTPQFVQDRIRASMSVGVERAGADLFQSIVDADLRPDLGKISAPSVLLLGDRRWITPEKEPSVISALGYGDLLGLEVRLIPSHHFVMLECPELVTHITSASLTQFAHLKGA